MRLVLIFPATLAAAMLLTAAASGSTVPTPRPTLSDAPAATATPTPSGTTPTPSPTPTTTPPTGTTPTTTPPTPSPTPTTTTVPRSLTLNPPITATPWEDRAVTFSGKLTGGQPGWMVALWGSTATGWQLLTWSRIRPDATYSISYAFPNPGASTVKTATGGTLVGTLAASAVRTLTVLNRTNTLAKPAASWEALTNVTVYGRAYPPEPGRQVMAEFYSGGAWHGYHLVTTDPLGYYRFPVQTDRAYHWIMRTRTVEVPATAVEYSALVVFDIRVTLRPYVFAVTAAYVSKTYRSGCPVGPTSLRRVMLTRWGMDGKLYRGELIMHSGAVPTMLAIWTAALASHFPIRQMIRVDVFGGNDVISMAADNTSMFNCRNVTGNPYALSPHSYGYAIDINTVENPYQDTFGRWYPFNGLSYRDRTIVRPGMLFDGSTPTLSLVARGYFWGRFWSHPDYQHFQPR